MKGRFSWWPQWIEKKKKYAQTDVKQMDEDKFNAICVGTGLPPIYQRSTFNLNSATEGANRFLGHSPSGEKPFARVYTRLGNPSTEHLEKVLFQLECSHIIENSLKADEPEPTIGGFVYASGMAAISTTLMSFLKSGDAIVIGNVYGCTDSFVRFLEERFNIEVIFIPHYNIEAFEEAFDKHPNIVSVLIETPVNPTLELYDIEAISKITEANEALFIVDNTFCSPFLQQPFRLGADIVIHSLTKFVNGHSASIAGAAFGPWELFSGEGFMAYKDFGGTPSPFDSWLNSLCVQDMGVRIAHQSKTAEKLADFLVNHPAIDNVYYPGLKSHPQHELHLKQMRNGGSLIAFELKGGYDAGVKLMDYFGRHDTPMELAVSLGSVISYIQHPASMTHGIIPEEDRVSRGITNSLVRLSVGAEGYSTLANALEIGLSLYSSDCEI